MENKFDTWNNLKKQVNKKEIQRYIKERQVWYVNLWKNIWFEEDGKWDLFKRPILVVKKVWSVFFVVPLTTKWKDNQFYYKFKDWTFKKDSYSILSQVRILDKNRFIVHIWNIDKSDFEKIKKSLQKLLL